MSRALLALLPNLLLVVGGCNSFTESDFVADYEELYCEAYATCASDEMRRTVNERECLEFLRYQVYPVRNNECKYSADAAESCITDLASAGCAGTEPEVPLICEDVFSKCLLPVVPGPNDLPVRPPD